MFPNHLSKELRARHCVLAIGQVHLQDDAACVVIFFIDKFVILCMKVVCIFVVYVLANESIWNGHFYRIMAGAHDMPIVDCTEDAV